jgi:hypothetical protein
MLKSFSDFENKSFSDFENNGIFIHAGFGYATSLAL